MYWIRFLLLFGLLLPAASFAQAGACKSYEPAVVTLEGKLVRKTFPGPPNYADIRKGDRPETYWLLLLTKPICVNEDQSQPDLNPAVKSAREIQLVMNADDFRRYQSLLGKNVIATGSLFGAETGHHHTPVLLTVKKLDTSH
jgi:hypothetical protein